MKADVDDAFIVFLIGHVTFTLVLNATVTFTLVINATLFIRKSFFGSFIRGRANANPHYQNLCARVSHVWGNRKPQPQRSAMPGPHPEGAALLITASSAPGKYEVLDNQQPNLCFQIKRALVGELQPTTLTSSIRFASVISSFPTKSIMGETFSHFPTQNCLRHLFDGCLFYFPDQNVKKKKKT